MSAEENQAANNSGGDDVPLTVELLADLQAGLLDDATAAQVRRRVRADPDATAVLRALNRVRGDVAALATDTGSAPDPPPEVAARHAEMLAAMLRSTGPTTPTPPRYRRAAHALRPGSGLAKTAAAAAGLGAFIAAIGVGTAALMRTPTTAGPAPNAAPTAQHITVSSSNAVIPLTDDQLLGLLEHSPDYGPLRDPARRASCLSGLGYPVSTPILGARLIEINGRHGVLLVLPGETTDKVAVIAVPATCSAVDTGLLASTVLARR